MASAIAWTLIVDPPLLRPDTAIPTDADEVPLQEIFRRAGVRLRACAPPVRVLVRRGGRHMRTPSALVVAVSARTKDLTGRRAALRVLEALAHGFFLHEVRHSICGRGLFCAPKTRARGERR